MLGRFWQLSVMCGGNILPDRLVVKNVSIIENVSSERSDGSLGASIYDVQGGGYGKADEGNRGYVNVTFTGGPEIF